ILREIHEAVAAASPISRSKSNSRRPKSSKENAPPAPSPDPNSPALSKIKSPLPPRPPLKRKLAAESGALDNFSVPANPSDSGVKVMIRIRPPEKDEGDGGHATQNVTKDSLTISGQTFTFDSVADVNSKQLHIFEHIGAPLVENCLSGFNSSVFAYGQTGSGKTYTIWGPSNALLHEDHQGLAPRVFQRLFERIEEEQLKQADRQLMYMCRCSFLEIYNEQITDLLDPGQKSLQIREDVKTGVYVENLREECVSSMKDVSQLLMKGLSNRRTSATHVNAESSRSHSVFTCVIESRIKSPNDGLMRLKTSKINFVDLAGSERQKQTGAAGERLKEAGNINRSLSQLGNLINILAEVTQTGKQRHIPYRDSKLTFLLQESLGGNAKLAMICAISPSQSCKNETLSTLRFAQRAKSIKNRAIVNEELQDDVNVLREVIRQLRDELTRMKTDNNQNAAAYATGWSARRSLNLLRFSLNRPTVLPHAEDDSDEEMEIVDNFQAAAAPFNNHYYDQGREENADVNMDDVTPEIVVKPERKSQSGPMEVVLFDEEQSGRSTEQCCNDMMATTAADADQINVSPPSPSLSPTLSSSRKSPRTSSALTASQRLQIDEAMEATEPTAMNPSKSSTSLLVAPLSKPKSCFASTQHLADALRRGLEIMDFRGGFNNQSMRKSAVFSFTRPPTTSETKIVAIPVSKVEAGVQASFNDDEEGFLCRNCKDKVSGEEALESYDNGHNNMQIVAVNEPPLLENCRNQVPKAVEKVLAGAIRREMALEELCSKRNSEITLLNRLVEQYKHERRCNEILSRTREDKISRLESLMDGILPTEDFMDEEFSSLVHQHKILLEKYENHPDVTRTQIDSLRLRDEMEKYRNFFDFGERDVLLEEIQDLRNQLQFYVDSSCRKQAAIPPPLPPPCETTAIVSVPSSNGWIEAESKWITLVEELRTELNSKQRVEIQQRQELDTEKKCCEELKEALSMAMEGHARMLEQYADLEEKHIQLLARHRRIQDGIDDVKKAAAKAGVRGESKFVNALAAEISALKVEREKERRFFRDEKRGLQSQLRDTAEAVEAAGELLVRLKEAEEALATQQRRVRLAEEEKERAMVEIEKLKK
ncbi:hypothetical protein M569_04902, partial [Genlisea aurea]